MNVISHVELKQRKESKMYQIPKAKLVQMILKAQNEYWETGSSYLSDSEWDKLIEQLRSIDPNHPVLDAIGGKVGDVKHTEPMLSLQKVYTVDELCKWIKLVARDDKELFVIQPKYDGICLRHQGIAVSDMTGLWMQTAT